MVVSEMTESVTPPLFALSSIKEAPRNLGGNLFFCPAPPEDRKMVQAVSVEETRSPKEKATPLTLLEPRASSAHQKKRETSKPLHQEEVKCHPEQALPNAVAFWMSLSVDKNKQTRQEKQKKAKALISKRPVHAAKIR